jgi:LuxR family maltose regulon positive regulatory protein
MLSIALRLDEVEPCLQEVEKRAAGQLPLGLQLQIRIIRAELARHRNKLAESIELSHDVLKRVETLPPEDMLHVQAKTGAVFNLAWAQLLGGGVIEAEKAFVQSLEISRAAGSATLILLALRGLGLARMWQGRLQQAAEAFREGIRFADDRANQTGRPVGIAAYVHLGLGEVLREWNSLDESARHLARGLEMGLRCQVDGETLRDGYISLARLNQARGDLTASQRVIRDAEQMADTNRSVPNFSGPIAACRAQVLLAQYRSSVDAEDLKELEQWADGAGFDIDGSIDSVHDEAEHLIWARYLIVRNQPDRVLTLLTRMLQAARKNNRTGRVIEIIMLQALSRQIRGEQKRAAACLKEALSLAESGGYVRLFVDEGDSMAHLLRQLVNDGGTNGYAAQLLQACSTEAINATQGSEKIETSVGENLFEPLSEREREVLKYLATDLTGPEIAERIFVSHNTVKTHIKRIYDKLHVHSRFEAVQKAKELGLTP